MRKKLKIHLRRLISSLCGEGFITGNFNSEMVVPGQGVVAARSIRSTARTLHKSDCSNALKSVLKVRQISLKVHLLRPVKNDT